MFKKILIANRGEIALRIMATCREMGVRTVAVYSEADRSARHVLAADEAYCIGPAPAPQSYLHSTAVIATARNSGAEAIHPGYGFLSENAAFAEACEGAGLVFIGPSASAMRLMGSKIAAKELARSVGAPTVPGYNGESQDDAVLLREAERIGFPLLIKASAGGGGKGMRAVHTGGDFLEQLAGARREALAAFGDQTVFLERLIERPRHIEIQILGDTHGELIHLGERECSIQRRHQKIVEESPSSALSPAVRAEMGEVAIRIARAANYVNAGTLEFMLDEDGRFYFLEMNTRLQVEHAVTEMVTGLDLVRQQLRIAAGEALGFTQSQITQRGHAIEARIYAEDATQNFLPSTGTITRFFMPEGPGIRVDRGVGSGDEISQYYDPMIAKLIVYGEDRAAAVARLRRALAEMAIFGVTTNLPLLHAISAHPAFSAGLTFTNFLDEHRFIDNNMHEALPEEVLLIAALGEIRQGTLHIDTNNQQQAAGRDVLHPWQTLGPWRMIGEGRVISYTYQAQDYQLTLRQVYDKEDTWSVRINEAPAQEVRCTPGNDTLVVLIRGAQQTRAYVHQQRDEIQVALDGNVYRLQRRQPPTVEATGKGGGQGARQNTLTAPMAGTIIQVRVREGETVAAHQVLMILSAMKMEHSIAAPHEGKVRRVLYQEGAVVQGSATVIEME